MSASAEFSLLNVVCWLRSCVSGARSTATNWVTRLDQSKPEANPAMLTSPEEVTLTVAALVDINALSRFDRIIGRIAGSL
jgi:hypothetical protein